MMKRKPKRSGKGKGKMMKMKRKPKRSGKGKGTPAPTGPTMKKKGRFTAKWMKKIAAARTAARKKWDQAMLKKLKEMRKRRKKRMQKARARYMAMRKRAKKRRMMRVVKRCGKKLMKMKKCT